MRAEGRGGAHLDGAIECFNAARDKLLVRVAVPELPKSSPAPRPHLAIGHCERVRAACGNVLDMHLGKGSERPRDGAARWRGNVPRASGSRGRAR